MKSTRPILAALRRSYSQAAAQEAARVNLSKQAPKVSQLSNGITVATLETYSPVSRVAMAFNAGSRYEDSTTEGAAHFIRSTADLSSEKSTGFNLTRSMQQIGGNFTCTGTREHIIYAVECLRNSLGAGTQLLSDACSPAFKSWEVEGASNVLRHDLAVYNNDPTTLLIEALHKAAYRKNLGNSLYMPSYRVGSHTPQGLKSFASKHLNPGNMTIVGVGVDHEQFLFTLNHELALNKVSARSAVAPTPSQYFGGEVRIETGSNLVHAAVVSEGVSLSSSELLPLAVLQRAMGTECFVKYGGVGASKLSQAAAQVTSSPYAVSALNVNYSDSGLFGFHVITEAADAEKVLKAVLAQFSNATKGGVSEQDVQRGKTQLSADMLRSMESDGSLLQDIAIQASLTGNVLDVSSIEQAINKITTADVQSVAKKVINGKPSMAAVGNLSGTPYLDQLV
jgi:ubiquinol-cytochrome c reductase core subunit 2